MAALLTVNDLANLSQASVSCWRRAGWLSWYGQAGVILDGEEWIFRPTEYADRLFTADVIGTWWTHNRTLPPRPGGCEKGQEGQE